MKTIFSAKSVLIFVLGCLVYSVGTNAEDTYNMDNYYVRIYLKLKNDEQKKELQKVNGLVVSADGYILSTNYIFFFYDEKEREIKEVDYEKILVELNNFKILEAEYVARDEKNDLVLLKVNNNFKSFVTFENIDLKVGDTIWVNSLWLETPTINKTKGIVSAIDRMKGCAYQIDAKVDFASIGGLVTNNDKRPIGIVSFLNENNAKTYGWGMNSGIGFATKSQCIAKSLNEMRKGKNISAEPTPFLGVQGDMGVGEILGARIKSVVPNTPAHKAGLKDGDVIIKYGDKVITEWVELIYAVSQTPLNSKITLEVIRNYNKIQLELFLDKKRKEFVK